MFTNTNFAVFYEYEFCCVLRIRISLCVNEYGIPTFHQAVSFQTIFESLLRHKQLQSFKSNGINSHVSSNVLTPTKIIKLVIGPYSYFSSAAATAGDEIHYTYRRITSTALLLH